MPADFPTPEQLKKPDPADVVRALRTTMPELPFRRLATIVKTPAPVLCNWVNGRVSIRPSLQRTILRVVRAEFAKHATRVARLAQQHGIDVGA